MNNKKLIYRLSIYLALIIVLKFENSFSAKIPIEQKHTLNVHTNKINCIAVSKNNKYFATGSWDGRIIVWN
jgi:WD40 repeat protein